VGVRWVGGVGEGESGVRVGEGVRAMVRVTVVFLPSP